MLMPWRAAKVVVDSYSHELDKSAVQMEIAELGPLLMFEHRVAAPEPWKLLGDVLSFKIRDLRAAAELQVRCRETVVWHPPTQPSSDVRKSCFSLLSKHDAAGRPKGD